MTQSVDQEYHTPHTDNETHQTDSLSDLSSLRLVRYYLKLGDTLYDLLEETSMTAFLAEQYQNPGKNRKTAQEVWSEISTTHPEIKATLLTQADEMDFVVDQPDKWARVVSCAMRFAGMKSGYHYTAAELQILIAHAGELSDTQISLLLPGRTPGAIESARSKLGLPNTMNLWSDEEEQILREGITQGLTDEEIATRISTRTSSAVKSHRQEIGLLKRNWTDQNNSRLRELFNSRVSTRQMAIEFGVDRSTISRHLLELGLSRAPSLEEIQQMIQLARRGHTYKQIAQELDYPVDIIETRLRAKGLDATSLWQWTDTDTQTLEDGYRQGQTDEELAKTFDRPLWQIKYLKFTCFRLQYVDEFETRLVQLYREEGIFHPLAIYLRDQVKMNVQLINNIFFFCGNRANLSKALRNYIEKNGQIRNYNPADSLRAEILRLHAQGKDISEVASQVDRGIKTVTKVIQQANE